MLRCGRLRRQRRGERRRHDGRDHGRHRHDRGDDDEETTDEETDTEEPDLSAFASEDCLELRASARSSPSRSARAVDSDPEATAALFDELVDKAPDEIKDDLAVMADAMDEIADAHCRTSTSRAGGTPDRRGAPEAPGARRDDEQRRDPAGLRRTSRRGRRRTAAPAGRDVALFGLGRSGGVLARPAAPATRARAGRRSGAGSRVPRPGAPAGRRDRRRRRARASARAALRCRGTSPRRVARSAPRWRGTGRGRSRPAGRGWPTSSRRAAGRRSRCARRCPAAPRRRRGVGPAHTDRASTHGISTATRTTDQSSWKSWTNQ